MAAKAKTASKPKPAKKAPVTPWTRQAATFSLAQTDHRAALSELEKARHRLHETETVLATMALGHARNGIEKDATIHAWLVWWWNNGVTSPREYLRLPCVTDVESIPRDVEPEPCALPSASS